MSDHLAHHRKWSFSRFCLLKAHGQQLEGCVESAQLCEVLDPVEDKAKLEIFAVSQESTRNVVGVLAVIFETASDEVLRSQILHHDPEGVRRDLL